MEGFSRQLQHKIVHDDAVNAVCFSYDEKLLASASWDCTFKVWDLENLCEIPIIIQSEKQDTYPVFCISFSRCGKYLAMGS